MSRKLIWWPCEVTSVEGKRTGKVSEGEKSTWSGQRMN